MREFRTLEEVGDDLPAPLRQVVTESVRALLTAYGEDYDPDDCGWVVLVDEETTDDDAERLFGAAWEDLLTEGTVHDKRHGVFLTAWLANNQFGITLVVPDEPWLPRPLRERLEADVVNVVV